MCWNNKVIRVSRCQLVIELGCPHDQPFEVREEVLERSCPGLIVAILDTLPTDLVFVNPGRDQ